MECAFLAVRIVIMRCTLRMSVEVLDMCEQFETVNKERKRNNMTHKFGIWKYPRLYFADFGLAHFANQAIFYKLASFFNPS